MSFLQAVTLAIIQGITEFLPISSSGHLVLFQKIFGFNQPPVLFDTLLHFGTLGAVIIFFKDEIKFLILNWKKKLKIWGVLMIGSLPAAIFGLFLSSRLDTIFASLTLTGVMWIIFGTILLTAKRFKTKNDSLKSLEEIKPLDSLIIGIFQAAALFPGVSRSGSTILGGQSRNFSPKLAMLFSFLLSIPAILGATFLELSKVSLVDLNFWQIIIPMFIAGLTGYVSLKILQKVLVSEKLYIFGFYCLLIGLLALFL